MSQSELPLWHPIILLHWKWNSHCVKYRNQTETDDEGGNKPITSIRKSQLNLKRKLFQVFKKQLTILKN